MKRAYLLSLLALGIACPLAHAQDILRRIAGADAGIGIEQVGVLPYPPSMIVEGIFSGEVRAVISVDSEGKLTDWLITGYTQRAFADAASAALQRWRYQPAMVNNTRRASRAHVLFEFRSEGVVVQTLPGAMVKQFFGGGLEGRYLYQSCQLRDLDRIPEPEHVVSPSVKLESAARSVTVEFYIDEQGRVRMPAVDRESADDVLAAAAVAAVEQWRFKPPLRKGKPVLVYVEQEFSFRAKE